MRYFDLLPLLAPPFGGVHLHTVARAGAAAAVAGEDEIASKHLQVSEGLTGQLSPLPLEVPDVRFGTGNTQVRFMYLQLTATLHQPFTAQLGKSRVKVLVKNHKTQLYRTCNFS